MQAKYAKQKNLLCHCAEHIFAGEIKIMRTIPTFVLKACSIFLSIFPGGMKRNPPPPSLSSHSGHSSSFHGVFREHIILRTVWSVLISTLARSIRGEVFFEQKKAWNNINIDGPRGGEVRYPLEVYPHPKKSQKKLMQNTFKRFFSSSEAQNILRCHAMKTGKLLFGRKTIPLFEGIGALG